MTLVLGQKERGLSRTIQIFDAGGEVITPGEHDLVRVRINRQGQPDVLTVTSGTPSANGSTVIKGSTNMVVLVSDDLDFAPGTYTLLVEYWDNTSARWMEVGRECIVLEHTS